MSWDQCTTIFVLTKNACGLGLFTLPVRTQIQTWIRTRIQTPKPVATLQYARSQIQITILTANYRNGIGIRVRTRVRLSQCK